MKYKNLCFIKLNIVLLIVSVFCLFPIFRMSVMAQEAKISINKNSGTYYYPEGGSLQLKAVVQGKSKKVTWKSSNKKVATVSSGGKVRFKKTGTVTITASANGKRAKCTFKVKKALSDILKQIPQVFWWSSRFKYSIGFTGNYAVIGNTYGKRVGKYKINYIQKTTYGLFININGYYNYRWYKAQPYYLQCYSSASGNTGYLKSKTFYAIGC